MKRLMDIILASFLLILASPLLMVVAALVRINLGKPIFFRQTRPGRHGRPFGILKFRSMRDIRDKNGAMLPDKDRLTSFGKVLRASSLDELPELFNVLKGEMSLVGPRPLLMQYLPLYSARQARRHEVRPGMTGWAQVNGRNSISWQEKFELDVWYVDNQSLALDVAILLKTLGGVIKGDGITQTGHMTVEPFSGNDTKETQHENHQNTAPR